MIKTLKRLAATALLTTIAIGMATPADAANQYFRLRFDTVAGTASYRIAGVFQVAVDSLNFTSYVMEVDSRVGITISTVTTFVAGSSVTVNDAFSVGVTTLVVNNARVGIGTDSPLSTLDVAGNFAVSGASVYAGSATVNNAMLVTGAMAVNGTLTVAAGITMDAAQTHEILFDHSNTAVNPGLLTWKSNGTTGAQITMTGSANASPNQTQILGFASNASIKISGGDSFGSNDLIIAANGNVGVKTASPLSTLEVAGNFAVSGASVYQGSVTVNAPSLFTGAHTIPDDTVTTSKIKDDAVTSAKLFRQPESLLEVSGGAMFSDGTNIGIGSAVSAPNMNMHIDGGDPSGAQLKLCDSDTTCANAKGVDILLTSLEDFKIINWQTGKDFIFTTTGSGDFLFTNGDVIIESGAFRPLQRTKAQLEAITPTVGDIYGCTNCDNNTRVLVGTGTLSGFAQFQGTATWH